MTDDPVAARAAPRTGRGATARAGRRAPSSSTPRLPGDRPGRLDRVGPARRPARAPPAGQLAVRRRARPRRGAAGRAAPRRAPRPRRRSAAGRPAAAARAGSGSGARPEDRRRSRRAPTSWLPRPTLRRSACSRPGSSVVRSSGSSSESGLASRMTLRGARRRRAARSASRSASPTNGIGRRLDVARARPARCRSRRRSRCASVRPRPAGAAGSAAGHGVVADQPDDLLDEVGRVGEVGPPGRRRHEPRAGVPVDDRAADRARGRADDVAWSIGSPAARAGRAGSSAISRSLARAGRPRSTPTYVAPPSSASSATARAAATGPSSGSTPRSNRRDASLDSLCRRAIRAIGTGVEVRRLDHEVGRVRRRSRCSRPPITPARPIGPRSSVISRSSGSSVARSRGRASRAARPAPRGARRSAPVSRAAVEGVQRLAELEHHVVGDVDGERDRPHAALHEPRLQPDRARRRRVEAGDACAATKRSAAVGSAICTGCPGRPVSAGSVERRPGRGTRRRTPSRPRGRCRGSTGVAAVRRDRDVEHLVAQAEQLGRVAADGSSRSRRRARGCRCGRRPMPSSRAEQIMPSLTWP